MMPKLKMALQKSATPLACAAAVALAYWVGRAPSPEAAPPLSAKPAPVAQSPAPPAPPVPAAEPAPAASPAPVALSAMSLDELRHAWNAAATMTELQGIAEELASRNTSESVKLLLDAIGSMEDWPSRADLAKNLRAVSDPETLSALLPALLGNYGRGNTILNEIADAVDRMAQPDTVEALAVMHWQASAQAGQGHKILRTVAGIRNPPARRALARLAEREDSPALAAAAAEALKNMPEAQP